jgi:hypothetical protein
VDVATGLAGPEFVVNRRPMALTDAPALAVNAAGEAVIVWTAIDPDGGESGALMARRLGATGRPLDESDQQLATLPPGSRGHPSVSIDRRGDFVIAWQTDSGPGAGVKVHARRFGTADAEAVTGSALDR